tara:strand:+ start:523 stop:699 length:177 start_codon:yes stop_codon:yes gene_type:complete
MCKTEDLLYEAHHEGIRDEVLKESRRLYEQGGKYNYMEFADRLELALNNIRNKKNENI